MHCFRHRVRFMYRLQHVGGSIVENALVAYALSEDRAATSRHIKRLKKTPADFSTLS